MPMTPEQQSLFNGLSQYPGLAAWLFGLADPGKSTIGKVASTANEVGTLSSLSGELGGPTLPASVTGPLGGAGAAAGLGLGAYNLATAPNYQGKLLGGAQTALAAPSVANATGVGAGAIGGAAPAAAAAGGYLAAAVLTDYLINKTGAAKGDTALADYTKGVDALVKPQGVSALFGGHPLKYSGKQALTGFTEDAFGATPFMAALGLGPFHKPTTGTQFRQELSKVASKFPMLKDLSTKSYTVDFGKFKPEEVSAANQLGAALAQHTAAFKKNPQAYTTQASAMLLNHYGAGVVDLAAQFGL